MHKNMRVGAALRNFILFLCLVVPHMGLPCTTFILKGGDKIYLGRNLDWFWENGLVIVNQRNIEKTSLAPVGSASIHWTSRYGSVTFNQFGQEMPYGGMNEMGLVVESMWLDQTKYAGTDSKPAINLLQWIQYQLDNCSTIDEVLASNEKIRIYAPSRVGRIHYLICDAHGNWAIVEVLAGRVVCTRGERQAFPALANDTYEESETYAESHSDTGTVPDKTSLNRFCMACRRATNFKPATRQQNLQYAFDTLDQVAQGSFTVWSIVYDISGKNIQYRTRHNPQPRNIDLKALNFSCGGAVLSADIEAVTGQNEQPKFDALTQSRLQGYLEQFVGDPSLRQRLGDLSPQISAQLQMVSGFHCDESAVRTALKSVADPGKSP